jgi:hypothetical protein
MSFLSATAARNSPSRCRPPPVLGPSAHVGRTLTADIQEKLLGHQPEVQGQMLEGYEATHHPWLHDPRAQAEQHLRDEAAYPEGSPWRYNDITSYGTDNERSV